MFFAVCQSRDISSSERADHELVWTVPGSSHCILPKVQLNVFRTFPNLSKLCDSFARPVETIARELNALDRYTKRMLLCLYVQQIMCAVQYMEI
ncbi:unnamed protein product [Sphagnum balticum]